jgi:hypothetical protein
MVSLLFLRKHAALPLLIGTLAASCRSPDRPMSSADSQAAHVREVVAAGGVVDSILPIAEQLRRFRASVGNPPSAFVGGTSSIAELATTIATALQSHDTSTVRALVLTKPEFAWFYYEHSPMAREPYEVPPGLLWDQIIASSDEGARRLFQLFGGQRVRFREPRCATVDSSDVSTHVFSDCTVSPVVDGKRGPPQALFGTIVSHSGRFKLLSYANRL